MAHLAILKLLFLSSVANTAPPWESSFFLQSMPPDNCAHMYTHTHTHAHTVDSQLEWKVSQDNEELKLEDCEVIPTLVE